MEDYKELIELLTNRKYNELSYFGRILAPFYVLFLICLAVIILPFALFTMALMYVVYYPNNPFK